MAPGLNTRLLSGRHLLSALTTKAPLNLLPAPRLQVNVLLHDALWVIDDDFLFLDCQIRRYVRASHFTAISAVAQMTARPGEQFVVVDGHADGLAETCCAKGFGELRDVIGTWVAGEFAGIGHCVGCVMDEGRRNEDQGRRGERKGMKCSGRSGDSHRLSFQPAGRNLG